MSDNNKQDLVPGGQSEADEEGGLDPGSLGGAVVPVEWLAAVAGIAALLAFQMIVKAFEEKGHEEEVPSPAPLENKNMEPVEMEVEAAEEEEGDNEEEGGGNEDNIVEEEKEQGAAAAGACRVLDTKTKCKPGYFRDLKVPKPLSLLAKEAIQYNYKNYDEESEERGGEERDEEENENEKLEEEPKRDSAKGNLP